MLSFLSTKQVDERPTLFPDIVRTTISVNLRGVSLAHADNPLDLYVGAAIGDSTVRADEAPFGYPLDYLAHHSAWKVLAGLRPIKIVGAEVQYIDFGHPGELENFTFTDVHAQQKPRSDFFTCHFPYRY